MVFQISIATEAVKKDNAGDYAGAVTLYCQALEYFVPAIHCEFINTVIL